MTILKNIKNIIFDLGGVVFDINLQLSVDAFIELGLKMAGNSYAELEQFDLFEKFETGKISTSQFRNGIRQLIGNNISDFEIDMAWTKMLLQMPEENIEILKNLKNKYKTFLLSNTNEIHCAKFEQIIQDQHGIFLADLFHKMYYSHNLKCRKPGKEIFLKVLDDNNIKAENTLFIDDTYKNIEGAEKVGLKTLFLEKGLTIKEIFC